MTDKQHGSSFACHLLHSADTFLPKSRISHREHLIYHENLGLEMRSYSKSEPDIHSTAVPLHRRIEKSFNFSEGNDLVKLPPDLPPRHAENRPVQKNVLAPGQLGMKTGAHLEQACNAAAH